MLVDAKGTVRAVEFAPQHCGLKLVRPSRVLLSANINDGGQATISSDNCLRIYECLEQPSLASWQLEQDIDVLALPTATPGARTVAHTMASATPTQTSAGTDGSSASLVAHALQQQANQNQLQGRPGLGTREVRLRLLCPSLGPRWDSEVLTRHTGGRRVVHIVV